MGRKILFITTDMMRWNSLGYTGDPYAQTPNLDRLASEGIQYHQARNQHPLCMPCRGSLITGQYPRTNGSWNNGIPLVHGADTIADVLHDAGYHTGLDRQSPLGTVQFTGKYGGRVEWSQPLMARCAALTTPSWLPTARCPSTAITWSG